MAFATTGTKTLFSHLVVIPRLFASYFNNIGRSKYSGRKSEFRGGRFSKDLKYSARHKNYSGPKKCVAILRLS